MELEKIIPATFNRLSGLKLARCLQYTLFKKHWNSTLFYVVYFQINVASDYGLDRREIADQMFDDYDFWDRQGCQENAEHS